MNNDNDYDNETKLIRRVNEIFCSKLYIRTIVICISVLFFILILIFLSLLIAVFILWNQGYFTTYITIFYNYKIWTGNNIARVVEAMVINKTHIIDVGTTEEIFNKYTGFFTNLIC